MAGQGISDLIDIWIYNQKEESAKKKLETFDGRKGVKAVIIDGELIYYGNEPVIEVIMEETSGEKPKPPTRGYIKKSTFDAMNVTTVSIPATFAGLEAEMMPPRLQYQLFRIVDVVENEDYVEVTARHVWYDNLKNYTLWEVPKANKDDDYTAAAVCRNIMTNAISPTGSRVASDCKDTLNGSQFDYKNKNLVEAFLDPENGVCAKFGLSMLRNNWDFYCLKNVGYDRGFVVENGKNLLGVERTESIENLVTRVAPIGKTKKGDIVWLDYNGSKYIDSPYIGNYSCPHVELYDTGIQIGQGGVTAQNIQQKLLEAAQKRFNEDHVDIPEVEMTIEFISLGDTEEYAQYRGLDKVYLYDILTIKDTVRGYSYTAQVVGVEHDILTGMLNSVTIGKLNNWDGTRKIATWQVPEVDGANIRLLSIQAGSFAPGAVGADDLMDAIITAAKIDVTDLTAINATLGTATIAQAVVESADISFAQIKALTAENLIAHDAVTDRYYISKLAVDNAQMVYATVGELVVKATDNKYYRLDIDANGQLSPTEVTLTQGEITAGITSDGRASIIETDLTVSDLSANNMKGITALIDKITASTINVQELFARQATITALNTADISNNNSLQIYVGTNAYTKKSGIEITDNGIEIDGGKWVKIKAGSGQTLPGKLIVESGNFTVDANGNVSMTGTVNAAAGSVIGGWTLGSNDLHAGSGSTYVAMASSGDYAFYAGSSTAADAPFRVKRDGTVTLTKLMTIGSGGAETEVNLKTAGLWKLSSVNLKDASYDSGTQTLTLTRFSGGDVVVNFSGAGSVNLEGSWVGNVYTVEDTVSGTSLSDTFSCVVNTGTTSGAYQNYVINSFDSNHKAFAEFSSASRSSVLYSVNVDASGQYTAGASSVTLSGAWSSRTFTVTASNSQTYSETLQYSTGTGYGNVDTITVNSFNSSHYAYARVAQSSAQGGNVLYGFKIDATGQYSAGETAGANAANEAVTLTGSWSGNTFTVTNSANNKTSATTISFSPTGNTINSFTNHSATITVSATGISGAMKTWTVNTTGEYNAGGATAKVNQSTQTLAYGGSVTVTAQYVTASGTTVSTSSSCTITAPADNKGTGWTLAVGKVSLPGAGTANSMSITTPGSTYNTSGATTYYVTADNNYAYIRLSSTSGTVVARASHSAYSNGASSVTLSAAGWSGGSNVVSASNGKSVTVNLPTISLTGGTTWSSHKTTVYASGGGASGSLASKEVDATSEYNAGWNACLDACGFGSYTKFYVGGSYARYAYSAPTSGATRYDYVRYGSTMASGKDVPARK